MKRSLIIKISLIISIALLIFSMVAGIVTNENDIKLMERELIRLTNLYAEYAVITTPEDVANISDKDFDVRVSVISMDGSVIAESLKDVETENHLYRQEVQNAINGIENKVVVRYSDTVHKKLAYYAVKANVGGENVIVRVSIPSINLNGFVTTTVIMFAILLLIITVLTAVLVSRTINSSLKPIAVIKKSLNDIKNGNFKSIMPNERDSEINELIIDINDVAENLSDTVVELNIERKKLQYLMENMSEAVIAVNVDGLIVMCNSNAKRIMNASYGMYIDLLLCDKGLEDVYKQSSTEMASSCVFEKDNKFYSFSVCSTPQDGEEITKIIIISDITKNKLAEQERREFFANCSHELKTPLAVIKGYAELIANGMVSGDKIIGYSFGIVKDSDRLLNIIDDMLTLSRLDENITGNPQKIQIKTLIEEIITEFNAVDELGLSVNLDGEGFNVKMANKNADGLIRNIIENAYKYNLKNGNISIIISDLKETGKGMVTIINSGDVIPQSDLARITERFYRVEKSRSDKKGSGLGLAIVKHICVIYGIEMTITSEEDKGTTVTLIFPTEIMC